MPKTTPRSCLDVVHSAVLNSLLSMTVGIQFVSSPAFAMQMEEASIVNESFDDAPIALATRAEQGNSEAQYEFAIALKYGIGVKKDEREARKWFERSAVQNHPWSQFELGQMLELGLGGPIDLPKALSQYRAAAELGEPKARARAGRLLKAGGRTQPEFIREAIKWLDLAANQNDSEAQIDLALAYAAGDGVEVNPEKALAWLKRAASQSDLGQILAREFESRQKSGKSVHPSTLEEEWRRSTRTEDRFMAALATRFGIGRLQDLPTSHRMFRQLSEEGHAPSAYYLSEMLLEGLGGPADRKASDQWCKHSAELGYAAAQVGMANRSGLNRADRVRWLRKAASQGFPLGQYLLGNALSLADSSSEERRSWLLRAAKQGNVEAARELGLDQEEDAEDWLLFAAEHGHRDAQRLIGEGLLYGENPALGIEWLRRAVEQGEANSARCLGDAYWHGKGVEKDLSQACHWYLLAMQLGGGLGLEQLVHILREAGDHPLPYSELRPVMQRLADNGHPLGIFAVGLMTLRGRAVPKDAKLAVKFFLESAKKGHAGAMVALGKLFREGVEVVRDDAQALDWFRKGAAHDDLEAKLLLARMLRDDRGEESEVRKAISLLEEAASSGYPEVYLELGTMFKLGEGVPVDLPKSKLYFEKAHAEGVPGAKLQLKDFAMEAGRIRLIDGRARESQLRQNAELGEAQSQLDLGLWLMRATYDRSDVEEGVSWVQKAADQGLPAAQFELAMAFESGRVPTEKDASLREQAVRSFRRAATGGHLEARYQLACRLRYGEAVEQREAFDWAFKAAQSHHSEAEALVAEMFARGIGTQASEGQAIEWALKATQNGMPRACFQIGVMYEQGTTVPKDLAKAFSWYLKGAEAGDAASQEQVAEMYEQGTGVTPDLKAAIHWYSKTAERYNSDPAFAIARIYLSGPPDVRNDAEALRWYMMAIDYSLEGGDGTEVFGQGEFRLFAQKYDNLATARYRLASKLETGDGLPKDLGQAVHWYERASDLAHEYPIEAGMAFLRLGVANAEGWNMKPDPAKALSSFRRAMVFAQQTGENPFAFMAERSLDWEYCQAFPRVYQALQAAAKEGNVAATAELAWLFQQGFGLPRHYGAAAAHRHAAIRAGYLRSAIDEAEFQDRLQRPEDSIALRSYLQLAALVPRDVPLSKALAEQRHHYLEAKSYRKVTAVLAEAKKQGRIDLVPEIKGHRASVTLYDPGLMPKTRKAMEQWAKSEGISVGHAKVFWEAGQLIVRAQLENRAHVRQALLEQAANLGSPDAMLSLSAFSANSPQEAARVKAYQWMLLAQAFGASAIGQELMKQEAALKPEQVVEAQEAAMSWWRHYHRLAIGRK